MERTILRWASLTWNGKPEGAIKRKRERRRGEGPEERVFVHLRTTKSKGASENVEPRRGKPCAWR